jgi:hypothetical protein
MKGNPGSVPALDDDHAHGRMSARDAATKTRPSPRPVAEGMTRDEIIAAEPIPATEPIPEDLVQRFRQFDGVELGCDNGLLRPDELPHGDEPGALGYRPAWLTQTYLPRMAPAQISSAARRALAERKLPLALLSHLPTMELFDRSYPWSTIGRVFVGTAPTVNDSNWMGLWTSSGTGAMVGRNLMVTASHVAPWGRGPGQWWMRFVPAYWGAIVGGGFTQPFGGSFVERFTGVQVDENSVSGRDVAICKLYRPLGDLTGWLARWRWFDDDEYRNWPYASVGYPGNPYQGQRPVVVPFAAIDDVDADGDGLELETHPFTSDGWSGGPLFFWRNGSPFAVGVASGREEEFDLWEFFTKTHSVFSGGRRFTDLIDFGWANWS